MKSKHLIAAFSVCALLFTTVSISNANSFWHSDSNNHQRDNNVTPEQSADLQKIYDATSKRIQPMRDDLYAKRLELDALAQNTNTNPATIKQLTEDITELRADIRAELEKSGTQIKKETGLTSYNAMHSGSGGHNSGSGGHNSGSGGHNNGSGGHNQGSSRHNGLW